MTILQRLSTVLWDFLDLFTRPPAPVPTPPPPPQPSPTPPPTNPLVAAINAARAQRGLSPLVEDPRLANWASDWAATMNSMRLLEDQPLSGVMTEVKCPVAAIVAEGQPDEASVTQAWLDSPSHAVLLLGNYTHIGTGHNGAFWAVDFARETT